ncbi:MAG TPA: 3-oxoacyl-[acyl-carrier-protein] synthase III C-terminal domain-containing protein [Thermoanaerobaculia bacterium]|jgi:3-oxoacyl-[acyl-carrier-protein] synthase-3
MPLAILGMGSRLPDCEIDNDFLHEEMGLERGPDWVESRLGIDRRFSVLSRDYLRATRNENPCQAILHARARGVTPVTMAVDAARQALARAGVRASQIGRVIANNDTPFEAIPSTAAWIAEALGIPTGPHGDINAACASFALHLQTLSQTREEHLPEFVLCVQTGAYTVRTNYAPNSIDGYIWGDGAAAQVLSARHPGLLRVHPPVFEVDARGAGEVVIDSAGFFAQNGERVREFSVRKTCELLESAAAGFDVALDEAWTVTHQANRVMQESVCGHLGIPEQRHLSNVRDQGNIAAAGCPSAIAQGWERIASGEKILYAVVGSGLAWGGGCLEAA